VIVMGQFRHEDGTVVDSQGADARKEALHRFVRQRRLRLARESQVLGEEPRYSSRVGKRVTQEELAEHLGISRGWYTRFEAGAPAGFSIALLNRLGDMLLLSGAERAELVRLAVPELVPVVPLDSANLRDMLGTVRRAVKRLWNATSEHEILHVAGEEARQLVPCFELIFARRIGVPEEAHFPAPGWNTAARYAEARAYAVRLFTPEQRARRDALWQSAPAGVFLPLDMYPADLRRVFHRALYEHGIESNSPVAMHTGGSSSSALIGGTSTRPHDVTELEHTMLSTIADFASLALR
jgi:transcriptional regulator with XRE-family HTH domain